MQNAITVELWAIVGKCTLKREELLIMAGRAARRRRRLALAAGVLALLSAGSIMSLLADYTPPATTKVAAVVLAVAAGFISLLSSLSVGETEITQGYSCATGFLDLRSRSHRALIAGESGKKASVALLNELWDDYRALSDVHARLLQRHSGVGSSGRLPAMRSDSSDHSEEPGTAIRAEIVTIIRDEVSKLRRDVEFLQSLKNSGSPASEQDPLSDASGPNPDQDPPH